MYSNDVNTDATINEHKRLKIVQTFSKNIPLSPQYRLHHSSESNFRWLVLSFHWTEKRRVFYFICFH